MALFSFQRRREIAERERRERVRIMREREERENLLRERQRLEMERQNLERERLERERIERERARIEQVLLLRKINPSMHNIGFWLKFKGVIGITFLLTAWSSWLSGTPQRGRAHGPGARGAAAATGAAALRAGEEKQLEKRQRNGSWV